VTSGTKRLLGMAVALLAVGAFPTAASAIPVLANGQGGVDCSLCHTAPPNLNAYGRYILATNLSKGLDAHLQMMENKQFPVALEVTANASNQPDPTLPKIYSDLVQFLSAGYLGPKMTYYASVPVEEGGFPSTAVDQVWLAYNGFSNGNGSVQVGKFPTPIFAPWMSQSLSLAGYGLAGMPVGLNDSTIGDNRWGVSYTQTGAKGLVGNVAYLTNSGATEQAFDNDVDAGGEGEAWSGSLQYMEPMSHLSGGVAAMSGTYPLPSGANDNYTREAALVAYSGRRYDLMAMGLLGHDGNPNDGATGAAQSHGFSFETIYGPLAWMHVNLRYETMDDGLGTVTNNYIGDLVFSLRPNLVFTVEDLASVGATPAISYQLLWAGPWFRGRSPAHEVSSTAGAAASAPSSPAAEVAAGAKIFGANCSACHGADGQGGVGPNLHGIATRMTDAQTVHFIEHPAGSVMPKFYPGVLNAQQVKDVAAFVRSTFS